MFLISYQIIVCNEGSTLHFMLLQLLDGLTNIICNTQLGSEDQNSNILNPNSIM